MYSEDEIELTAEERSMLAALPRELAPSDLLEERVVRSLKSAGYLGGGSAPVKSRLATVLKIAAGIALFAGGVATGRYMLMPDAPRAAVESIGRKPADTVQPNRKSAPPATETIVAEREIWM